MIWCHSVTPLVKQILHLPDLSIPSGLFLVPMGEKKAVNLDEESSQPEEELQFGKAEMDESYLLNSDKPQCILNSIQLGTCCLLSGECTRI